MKKLILIFFSLVFLSNNAIANDLSVPKFHEWLFENGHTEYINIEQSPGCKKLIQKHGLIVPKVGLVDEPKVKTNEWFWLECHKPQITNNLKIKFFKKKDDWFERFVNLSDPSKAEFKEEKIDIETIENHLNFEISKDQSVIEYSPDTFKYLRIICDLIKKNDGGMLVIDYGYADSKMHETLQAVNNHKYSNVLENIGDSDITYNINFHSFEKFINQFKEINSIFTNQKKFLTNMGILQRAEIISKNIAFSKKADLFYRVRRLIDENQMGELFKVMLVKNKRNNFKTGFQN